MKIGTLSVRAMVIAACAASTFPAGAQQVAGWPSKATSFLRAADTNDVAGMTDLLRKNILKADGGALSPQQFLKRVSGCYLRAVYSNKTSREVVAVWMCREGRGSSTVLANIGEDKDSILLSHMTEFHSIRPAPPRTGPAFGK